MCAEAVLAFVAADPTGPAPDRFTYNAAILREQLCDMCPEGVSFQMKLFEKYNA